MKPLKPLLLFACGDVTITDIKYCLNINSYLTLHCNECASGAVFWATATLAPFALRCCEQMGA